MKLLLKHLLTRTIKWWLKLYDHHCPGNVEEILERTEVVVVVVAKTEVVVVAKAGAEVALH